MGLSDLQQWILRCLPIPETTKRFLFEGCIFFCGIATPEVCLMSQKFYAFQIPKSDEGILVARLAGFTKGDFHHHCTP